MLVVTKDTADLIALSVSILALIGSGISFILNHRYTDRVFKMTEFPDLELLFAVRTRQQAFQHDNTRENLSDISPDDTVLYLDCRNKTNVDALNIRFTVTLTNWFRHIRFHLSKREWDRLKAQTTLRENFQINRAIVALAFKDLELTSVEVNKPWDQEQRLVCRNQGHTPTFGLFISMQWEPPLWRSKALEHHYASVLKPHFKNKTIKQWTTEPARLYAPFVITQWRPKKIDCETPTNI